MCAFRVREIDIWILAVPHEASRSWVGYSLSLDALAGEMEISRVVRRILLHKPLPSVPRAVVCFRS